MQRAQGSHVEQLEQQVASLTQNEAEMKELSQWLPLVPSLRKAHQMSKMMSDKIAVIEQQMHRLQLSSGQLPSYATSQRKVIQSFSNQQQLIQQNIQRLKNQKERLMGKEIDQWVRDSRQKVNDALASSEKELFQLLNDKNKDDLNWSQQFHNLEPQVNKVGVMYAEVKIINCLSQSKLVNSPEDKNQLSIFLQNCMHKCTTQSPILLRTLQDSPKDSAVYRHSVNTLNRMQVSLQAALLSLNLLDQEEISNRRSAQVKQVLNTCEGMLNQVSNSLARFRLYQ